MYWCVTREKGALEAVFADRALKVNFEIPAALVDTEGEPELRVAIGTRNDVVGP
jgi:hypothetical protein